MVAALDAFPLKEFSVWPSFSGNPNARHRTMLRPIRLGTIGPPWLGERRKAASTDSAGSKAFPVPHAGRHRRNLAKVACNSG